MTEKKSKESNELKNFQKVAKQLIANKMLFEYMELNDIVVTEPERFAEDWMRNNLMGAKRAFKSEVWKYFLEELFNNKDFN